MPVGSGLDVEALDPLEVRLAEGRELRDGVAQHVDRRLVLIAIERARALSAGDRTRA
ncbi:MAG: hypothetical protein M3P40_02930 [Actinomycetota bacterium]|nr:hypothetical protein [Actinomycetota bacterium]